MFFKNQNRHNAFGYSSVILGKEAKSLVFHRFWSVFFHFLCLETSWNDKMSKTDHSHNGNTVNPAFYFPLNQKSFEFKGSGPKRPHTGQWLQSSGWRNRDRKQTGLNTKNKSVSSLAPGTAPISNTVSAIVFHWDYVYLEELLPFILHLLTS